MVLHTSTSTSFHGTSVAGIIAADDDGDTGVLGVAPNASLHLSSYNIKGAENYYADHWANLTNDASSAIAQNNSWGIDYQIDTMQSFITNNGLSVASGAASIWTANGFTSDANSVTAYINALDDFQDHGVIVYALSNDSTFTDADFQAALPILFQQLDDAWITAVNIDILGSAGNETYTKKSAPCGQSAKFCLGADGHGLNTISHGDGYKTHIYQSGSSYYINTGTSWVAPMISGAVAIMAEAFPNQTPENWVDRLLASANNNIGFDHVGYVTFENGVVHGYSFEAGHGILDIYAALQPIISDSYVPRVLAINADGDGVSYELNNTYLIAGRSFGDALLNALNGSDLIAYDALDGGFSIGLDNRISPNLSVSKPQMSIKTELSRTILAQRIKKSILRAPKQNEEKLGYFEASVQQSNNTLQNHVAEGQWNGFNDVQYMFPFLSSIHSGDGLSFGDDIGKDYISFSWNKQHAKFSDGEGKEALTVSYSTTLGTATDLQFIGGVADENEYFLGTKGSGAFDFYGADNITSFFGVKSTTPIGDDLIISAGLALSYTDINKPAAGIITEMSGVTASAFEIGVTAFNVIGNDALSLSIGQPQRVESGSAHLKIAGLENQDGTVPFVEKTASLAPSGRQIDFAMAYNFDLDQTSAIRFKMMQTFEKGHVKDADPEASLYLGYATEEVFGEDSLAFGAAFIDDRDPSLELNYSRHLLVFQDCPS